jgi:hypothetical protein
MSLTEKKSLKFYLNCIDNDGSNTWKVIEAFLSDSGVNYKFSSFSFNHFGGLRFCPYPFGNHSDNAIKLTMESYGCIGFVPDDFIDKLNKFDDEVSAYIIGLRISKSNPSEADPCDVMVHVLEK